MKVSRLEEKRKENVVIVKDQLADEETISVRALAYSPNYYFKCNWPRGENENVIKNEYLVPVPIIAEEDLKLLNVHCINLKSTASYKPKVASIYAGKQCHRRETRYASGSKLNARMPKEASARAHNLVMAAPKLMQMQVLV